MSTNEPNTNASPPGTRGADAMQTLAGRLSACMQCGTCTGSCANSESMDITPRHLWRLVQLGLKDCIFDSATFWICSSCYYCTLRCPRGLPLTDAMGELKRIAVAEGLFRDRTSPLFYRTFLDTVRRYGRVREMEVMARYFLALRSPAVSAGFTPLGIKLLMKGKIKPRIPVMSGKGKLGPIYDKVREMEARS